MNRTISLRINRKEIYILLGLYILMALYLLYFSPLCGRSLVHRSIQPIPFKTIIQQFAMPMGFDMFLGNILGNVIVLLPIGFFLALLGWEAPKLKLLFIFMAAAFLVELIQYLSWVGCMDIDDIWMNGTGGVLGWWLGFRIRPKETALI